jgi:hypothetical protein
MTYDDPVALVDDGWNYESEPFDGPFKLFDLFLGMESGVVWARSQILDRHRFDREWGLAEAMSRRQSEGMGWTF